MEKTMAIVIADYAQQSELAVVARIQKKCSTTTVPGCFLQSFKCKRCPDPIHSIDAAIGQQTAVPVKRLGNRLLAEYKGKTVPSKQSGQDARLLPRGSAAQRGRNEW